MSKFLLTIFLSVLSCSCFCQGHNPTLEKNERGKFYLYWGWNRGWFTNSDISFKGDHYDFELESVSATDRQSSYSTKLYFGAKTFTIPQYNARLGYFFKDNWEISIGTDHMKYVVEQNQTVPISGYIENTNTIYDDLYENDKVKLEREFLLFEHTDGLNYVNAALRHSFKLVENNKIKFRSLEGVGLGILVPRTNATLLGKKRYDEFHFSGYGINATLGVNLTFLDRFFIQSELKGGFINMPNVRTTYDKSDTASHSFFFTQLNTVFGVNFNLKK